MSESRSRGAAEGNGGQSRDATNASNGNGSGNTSERTAQTSNNEGKDSAFKAGSSGPSLPAVTVPTGGGAIRGMQEAFNMDLASGGASMDIPLPVTKITRWGTPDLSLSYSSGGGNGAFGLGWAINGIPSIQRQTTRGLPTYGDEDAFVLDGSELVPEYELNEAGSYIPSQSTNDTHQIRRFKPRVQQAPCRIERWTDLLDPEDVHWRMIDNTNATHIFGRNSQSRIADTYRIFAWHLCEAYDSYGGAQLLEWKTEDSVGVDMESAHEAHRDESARQTQRYIKRIKYGNRTPNRSSGGWHTATLPADMPNDAWLFEVVFDYGDHDKKQPKPDDHSRISWPCRDDAFSSNIAGFEVRTYRLCERVLMYHHFPTELQRADCLVSTLEIQYKRSESLAFISAAQLIGYAPDGSDGYISKALPPLEFDYTQPATDEELKNMALQTVDPESMQNLPAGVSGSSSWVDLFGDGTTGILTQTDSAWYYKRNLGPLSLIESSKPTDKGETMEAKARFGALQEAALFPNLGTSHLSGVRPAFTDLNGDGCVDLLTVGDAVKGFYRKDRRIGPGPEIWEGFRPFPAWPNINMDDSNLRSIDLNGDGLADILITNDDQLLWYPARGEAGYGPEQRIALALNEEKGPRVLFSDPLESIFLADMCGDGLIDIVRIRNGDISYWPNQGYGHFGTIVNMDNAPNFDFSDDFTPNRLLLGDVDGSGTTDLLYLGAHGAKLFYNQAGNSWSNAIELSHLIPRYNSGTEVSAVDIFGTGTLCLAWTSYAEGASGSADRSLQYVDLMNVTKPHLLASWKNNLGLETYISYLPSTSYRLLDEYEDKPWVTKLPYPVHCVDLIVKEDKISKTYIASRFRYHHGYFDGTEREFRGFGMVERWDTEDYDAFTSVTGQGKTAEQRAMHTAPLHSKSWFHVGAYDEAEQLRAIYAREFFHGSDSSYDAFVKSFPGDRFLALVAGQDLSPEDYRQATRAMKGLIMREEVYRADLLSSVPQMVTDYGNSARMLQSSAPYKYGCFQSYQHEIYSVTYERQLQDPRASHKFNLEVDTFGNVVKEVGVYYGRNAGKGMDLPQLCQTAQHATKIIYTERTWTNTIDQADDYRGPLKSSESQYELLGLDPIGSKFNVEHVSTLRDSSSLPSLDYYYDGTVPDVPSKRMIGSQRIRYQADNLQGLLDLGKLQPLALPGQTFTLCLTKPMLSVYNQDGQSLLSNAPSPKDAGYLDLDSDGSWWIPSGTLKYDSLSTTELSTAQKSFFRPRFIVDIFNSTQSVEYDAYFLMSVASTDALGNRSSATIDYRTMSVSTTMDPNNNLTVFSWDALGMMVGLALVGKGNLDSLDGFQANLSDEAVEAYFANPTTESTALLSKATSRYIYDNNSYTKRGEPQVMSIILAETFGSSSDRKNQVSLSYRDGFGRAIQDKAQAENSQWRTSGWKVLNNKGLTVREFEPFFSPSPGYSGDTRVGVSSFTFYDPLNRPIATLYPDHTWKKQVYTAWSIVSYEQNDLVGTDPSTDADIGEAVKLLEAESYQPAWYESHSGSSNQYDQSAAAKSLALTNTPSAVYLDSQGQDVLFMRDNKTEKCFDKHVIDVQGYACQLKDGLDRTVTTSKFSMIGQPLFSQSMDSGNSWCLYDALGRKLYTWDSRKQQTRSEYDSLNRLLKTHVQTGSEPEVCVTLMTYGESIPISDAKSRNLRGQSYMVSDRSGTITFKKYNELGQPILVERQLAVDYKSTLDWSNAVDLQKDVYSTGYSYDALQRLVDLRNSNGMETTYQYNSGGKLVRLRSKAATGSWTSYVDNIEYDAFGRETSRKLGNGSIITKEFDPLSQKLTRERSYRGNVVLQDNSFFYDAQGSMVFEVSNTASDIYFRNSRVKAVKEHTFDGLGRLIEATGREHLGQTKGLPYSQSLPASTALSGNNLGAGDDSALRPYKEIYTYDLVDNMLSQRHEISDPRNPGWTRTYRYASPSSIDPSQMSNRLSATTVGNSTEMMQYDSYGNLTKSAGISAASWDYNNQLRSTTTQVVASGTPETTWYIYDSSGSRVRKVVERQGSEDATPSKFSDSVKLDGIESYTKYDGQGRSVMVCDTSHILDGGKTTVLEERWSGSGAQAKGLPSLLYRYQYEDFSQSIKLELDDQGHLLSYEETNPYGSTTCRASLSKAPKRYRYTAKERDVETGLYYFGRRYYMPWLCRWLNPDPLGTQDGPNPYHYVRGNPIDNTDPDGTMLRNQGGANTNNNNGSSSSSSSSSGPRGAWASGAPASVVRASASAVAPVPTAPAPPVAPPVVAAPAPVLDRTWTENVGGRTITYAYTSGASHNPGSPSATDPSTLPRASLTNASAASPATKAPSTNITQTGHGTNIDDVPSLAEFTAHLRPAADLHNVAFFYAVDQTVPGLSREEVKDWAAAEGYMTMTEAYRTRRTPNWIFQNQPTRSAAKRVYWDRASEAFARAASGTVRVMLMGAPSQGTNWYTGTTTQPTTFWDRTEAPILWHENRNVDNIIRMEATTYRGHLSNLAHTPQEEIARRP